MSPLYGKLGDAEIQNSPMHLHFLAECVSKENIFENFLCKEKSNKINFLFEKSTCTFYVFLISSNSFKFPDEFDRHKKRSKVQSKFLLKYYVF